MATPLLDDDFGFRTISEPLHVQAFISELAVEALVRSILPWFAGFDEGRLHATRLEPFFHARRHELRPIIAPDVRWLTMQAHQPREHFNDSRRVDSCPDFYCQAFSCPFIHDCQHLQLLPIGTTIMHKIICPDLIKLL